jgi:hypothetical protein
LSRVSCGFFTYALSAARYTYKNTLGARGWSPIEKWRGRF